ncbi:MAG: class I mannose-6-phosphate isomerase [Acidimicrobiia bacterium]
MSTMSNSALRPQRVTSTRVYRFYRGGALLGRLRGESEDDGFFPEDWIGSVTQAHNPGRNEPETGLSRLADGRLLRDAIEEDPEAWLGTRHLSQLGTSTGLLVKLLDAAERLPVHAHPDRAFARRYLGSRFGKTEAWVILGTRDASADVWLGLREAVEPAEYLRWIEEQEVGRLLGSLNRVAVSAGDIVYVPAGVPHAIGAGALIAELQEPTDLSLVCEWDGFPIHPEDSHLGLGWKTALGALDLNAHTPTLGLPNDARAFFWVDEQPEAAGRFAVLVVVAGEGEVAGNPARRGDCFAVPAAVEELDIAGSLRILRCLAPQLPS